MRYWLLALALASGPALGHDKWSNGAAVPGWVKASCCGPQDVHHLKPDQVHAVEGGFRVDGYGGLIPYSSTLPSLDGDYWGFWREASAGEVPPVFCFFVPDQGV